MTKSDTATPLLVESSIGQPSALPPQAGQAVQPRIAGGLKRICCGKSCVRCTTSLLILAGGTALITWSVLSEKKPASLEIYTSDADGVLIRNAGSYTVGINTLYVTMSPEMGANDCGWTYDMLCCKGNLCTDYASYEFTRNSDGTQRLSVYMESPIDVQPGQCAAFKPVAHWGPSGHARYTVSVSDVSVSSQSAFSTTTVDAAPVCPPQSSLMPNKIAANSRDQKTAAGTSQDKLTGSISTDIINTLQTSAAASRHSNSWFRFLAPPKELLSNGVATLGSLLNTGLQCLRYLSDAAGGQEAMTLVCTAIAYKTVQDFIPLLPLQSDSAPILRGP
jgi:hypothetical protein